MKAYIHRPSKLSPSWTIATEGKGGAIISAKTLKEAKEKYEEAMKLYNVVVNMQMFKKATEDNLSEEEIKATLLSKQTIEYIKV